MKNLKANRDQFLGHTLSQLDYQKSRFIILPVPYEATTSYGKGTNQGPLAILKASRQIEEFDEELVREPLAETGVYTLDQLKLADLDNRLADILKDNKIPVVLGGEHSLTPVAVAALAKQYKDLSVLQFDAHADLRDSYQGRRDSHACVMRRVLEVCPAVQVGIRNISREGYDFAKQSGQLERIHWAPKLELVEQIENQLSNNVYISIDTDVFDPSVVPSTGTPEPGGLLWYEVLDILKGVCQTKNIIGFDVTELSPRKGDIVSDFTVAKLIFKVMGYILSKPSP